MGSETYSGTDEERCYVCLGDGTANCFSEALANVNSCGHVGLLPSISPVDLGAVLAQLERDVWRVVAYASQSLSGVEKQ